MSAITISTATGTTIVIDLDSILNGAPVAPAVQPVPVAPVAPTTTAPVAPVQPVQPVQPAAVQPDRVLRGDKANTWHLMAGKSIVATYRTKHEASSALLAAVETPLLPATAPATERKPRRSAEQKAADRVANQAAQAVISAHVAAGRYTEAISMAAARGWETGRIVARMERAAAAAVKAAA